MSRVREPLSSFVEQVGYVSLSNRAGFYINEQVSTISSSSLDWVKPSELSNILVYLHP
jgi:hypothetical protein